MAKKITDGAPEPVATRQPRVIILCGKNGAGKTTLAQKLISQHRKPMVIAPSRTWGVWGNPRQLTIQAVKSGCDVIVYDDADVYLPANTDEFWIRTFSTNRHLGLDILLLSRRPQALPMWAVSAASHAYVLPVGPREKVWCKRILNVDAPESGYSPAVVTL